MSERDRTGEVGGERQRATPGGRKGTAKRPKLFLIPRRISNAHTKRARDTRATQYTVPYIQYPVPSTRYPLPLTCYPLTGSRLNGDSCCRHCNLFRALDNASRAAHINKMIMKFIITAVLLCVCVCVSVCMCFVCTYGCACECCVRWAHCVLHTASTHLPTDAYNTAGQHFPPFSLPP